MQQPSLAILEAFSIPLTVNLEKLDGGQGTTYLAGDIILKPANGFKEANWIAEVYDSIKQTGFRVPKPISSCSGNWAYKGWTAWEYLEGQTLWGKMYQERLAASQAFHKALARVPRPSFLDKRDDAWSQADRIVWQGAAWQPHARVLKLYENLFNYQTSLVLPEQVMHGDIAGNMLYKTGQAIAVIDFSPYWRPAAYAEALLCIDSLMWENAAWSMLDLLTLDETFIQLMLRAILRRLVEVDRHFYLDALPESHFDQVAWFEAFALQFIAKVLA